MVLRDQHTPADSFRCRDDLICLRGRARDRLLDHDMFFIFERRNRQFAMGVIGRAKHDHIDRLVRKRLLIGRKSQLATEFGAERVGLRAFPTGERDPSRLIRNKPGKFSQYRRVGARDFAAAKDAKVHGYAALNVDLATDLSSSGKDTVRPSRLDVRIASTASSELRPASPGTCTGVFADNALKIDSISRQKSLMYGLSSNGGTVHALA